MSWKWDIIQVKDEIEDIDEARTRTKRNNSRRQLRGRISALREAIRKGEGDKSDRIVMLLFSELGQGVLDGKITPREAFRLAGRWNEEGRLEELTEWAYRNSPAYQTVLDAQRHEAARGTVEVRTILTSIRNLKQFLARYEAQGATAATREAQAVQMKRNLSIPLIAVAATSDQPILGVTPAEWRELKLLIERAKRKVDEWQRGQLKIPLVVSAVPFRKEAQVPLKFMRIVPIGSAHMGTRAADLSLKLQQYRQDSSYAEELETALDRARSTLESAPTTAGADRLREVVSQAEAELSQEGTVPVEVPPQIQETARGPNWLALGLGALGLAGATTATVFIVKKVRSKKKKGK